MSDVPGLPRGSKTAAVVLPVVFFQLLVVAILGLGAISRDRKEGERQALEKAQADAEQMLEKTTGAARRDFESALREAAAATDAESLRAHAHGDLVRTVYVVDSQRVVYAVDGRLRLYVPPTVIARLTQPVEAAEPLLRELLELKKRKSPFLSLEPLTALARDYAFRMEREYPAGVGYAIELAKNASDAAAEDERGAQALMGALLQALETEAINRDRPEITEEGRAVLGKLQREVDAAVLAAPADQRDRLTAAVVEVRAARDGLAVFLPALLEAVGKAQAAGAPPPAGGERPRVLFWLGEELVAVTPRGTDRVAVLRLDLAAARRLIEDQAAQDGYAAEGLRVVVARTDETLEGRPIKMQDPFLPFRALLYRDRAPAVASAGPAETFYWGIIVLAALGLGIGGWILFRLLTREMRLARLKADFVSNLSHEPKTPLTSIALFTEMFQDGKLGTPEEQQEGFAVLAQESQRLQRIVARMIEVARREAQGIPYDLRRGDVNAPVLEAATRFRRIVTEPGMDLTVTLAAEPLHVRMDPSAVDDAVTNLLSNAWKYRRGDRARIAVKTVRRGRRAEVTVTDDGIGIPRSERRKVFQMFYRAEAYLTQPVAGTGLGLALVRTIVRAHRGRIRIQTGDGGVGTRVRIRLPLDRRPAPEAPPAPRTPPAPRKVETQVTP